MPTDDDTPPPNESPQAAARRKRLASELRANLSKRKSQARARTASAPVTADGTEPEADTGNSAL